MASFSNQITNRITNTTMLDFNAAIGDLGGPAKQCRFGVRILFTSTNNKLYQIGYAPFLRDLTYLCEATEFPGRGFDVLPAQYYGPELLVPYNTRYSDGGTISLSFLCRTESYERQLFDDWMEIINPSNTFNLEYPANYWAEIQVFQLADYPKNNQRNPTEGKAVYLWSLHNAWPSAVHPQQVTWADNDVLRLGVTFCFRYWSRPGRDPARSGQGVERTSNTPQPL